MKSIRLSKKDSKQITESLRKKGIPVKKEIKGVKFHKSFDKGWQYAVCTQCGHVTMFLGLWVGECSVCSNKKMKVFKVSDSVKFLSYQNKVVKSLWDKYKVLQLRKIKI